MRCRYCHPGGVEIFDNLRVEEEKRKKKEKKKRGNGDKGTPSRPPITAYQARSSSSCNVAGVLPITSQQNSLYFSPASFSLSVRESGKEKGKETKEKEDYAGMFYCFRLG